MHFDINANTLLTSLVLAGILYLIRTVTKLDKASAADVVWKQMHQRQDEENFNSLHQDVGTLWSAVRDLRTGTDQ